MRQETRDITVRNMLKYFNERHTGVFSGQAADVSAHEINIRAERPRETDRSLGKVNAAHVGNQGLDHVDQTPVPASDINERYRPSVLNKVADERYVRQIIEAPCELLMHPENTIFT